MKSILTLLGTGILLWSVDKAQIDALTAKIIRHQHPPAVPVSQNPFVGSSRPKARPLPQAGQKALTPILDGIFNKKALIGDRLYGVGEKVNGYTLTRVTDEEATFTKNGMIYAAKLPNGGSKILIKRDN